MQSVDQATIAEEPGRKPLSVETIMRLCPLHIVGYGTMLQFARAIERAHGIKQDLDGEEPLAYPLYT